MQHTTPTISFSRSIEDEDVQSSDELMHKSRTDGPGTGRRVTKSRRVSNAFFPPGFANEMETYEDEASGVTFQAGYDSLEGYQPPKVLMYDAERVLSTNSAWRALFTQTFHATALSSRNIFRKLMVYSAVAIVFIIMSPAFEADAEEAIDALNSLMAAGLFFLLGPFVVNAVQRWWDVRRNCVGALWGVVDDLSTYSASWCCPMTTEPPNPHPLTRDPPLTLTLLQCYQPSPRPRPDQVLAADACRPRGAQAGHPPGVVLARAAVQTGAQRWRRRKGRACRSRPVRWRDVGERVGEAG